MFRQMLDSRIPHIRHCVQHRFPLAVHYLFARDSLRVSFWVAFVVLVPSSLYYVVMHHVLPALLRDFLSKSPDEQQAMLRTLEALTMPPWTTLLTLALMLGLPLLLLLFVLRLTQPDARLSRRDVRQ